jgi:hypothetical protein
MSLSCLLKSVVTNLITSQIICKGITLHKITEFYIVIQRLPQNVAPLPRLKVVSAMIAAGVTQSV